MARRTSVAVQLTVHEHQRVLPMLKRALAILIATIPCIASAQAPHMMALQGGITFKRDVDSLFFTIADPRADAVSVRLISDLADKRGTLSFRWAQALIQPSRQVLSMFAPDDLDIGFVFSSTLYTEAGAACAVKPDERTETIASYVLRCVADDPSERARREGSLIYEVDIFVSGLKLDSEMEAFMRRASLPGRTPLLVFLENPDR